MSGRIGLQGVTYSMRPIDHISFVAMRSITALSTGQQSLSMREILRTRISPSTINLRILLRDVAVGLTAIHLVRLAYSGAELASLTESSRCISRRARTTSRGS
jgi:hypothetical protein